MLQTSKISQKSNYHRRFWSRVRKRKRKPFKTKGPFVRAKCFKRLRTSKRVSYTWFVLVLLYKRQLIWCHNGCFSCLITGNRTTEKISQLQVEIEPTTSVTLPSNRHHVFSRVHLGTPLNNNYRKQAAYQGFSLKQWFAVGAHSCRLRKAGSSHCYLRISEHQRHSVMPLYVVSWPSWVFMSAEDVWMYIRSM